MSSVVLDTSAYGHLLVGDTRVLDELAEADRVYLSVFVMGELLAGFRGGNKFDENRRLLKAFCARPTVEILTATAETADCFGQIKESLRRAGTPIPINDVWIAAHAMESGSVLISYDAHFHKVPGLRLWEHTLERGGSVGTSRAGKQRRGTR